MSGVGMGYKSLTGNALTAFAAQGVSMLVSVVMSLLVPKFMGVESYGYWQLFIFYVGYSGFFHFGLNDGVYLLEGGKARSEVDKRAINSQFTFGLVFQVIIGFCIAGFAAVWAPEADRLFVLFSFAVYTVVFNLWALLGYTFQAMNETRLFSLSTVLERLLFLALVLALLLVRASDFKPYILAYFIARCAALAYCCWCARDILCAGILSLSESLHLSLNSIKVGFSLMIAGIADMLILGVARGIIDWAWGIEVFGKVSFALSLVGFFMAFVSQGAMVLFPALRQGTDSERRAFYVRLKELAGMFFPASYLLYVPMAWALSLWLPQYLESMRYFAVLLPICVFNTKMSISCTTYFKVLRKEKVLLRVNIATMAASASLSLIGVFLLSSLDAVLLGTVVCLIGRSLWCEWYLDRTMGVAPSPVALEEIVLTAAFVTTSLVLPSEVSFVIYAFIYAMYLFINKNTVFGLLTLMRKTRSH